MKLVKTTISSTFLAVILQWHAEITLKMLHLARHGRVASAEPCACVPSDGAASSSTHLPDSGGADDDEVRMPLPESTEVFDRPRGPSSRRNSSEMHRSVDADLGDRGLLTP